MATDYRERGEEKRSGLVSEWRGEMGRDRAGGKGRSACMVERVREWGKSGGERRGEEANGGRLRGGERGGEIDKEGERGAERAGDRGAERGMQRGLESRGKRGKDRVVELGRRVETAGEWEERGEE